MAKIVNLLALGLFLVTGSNVKSQEINKEQISSEEIQKIEHPVMAGQNDDEFTKELDAISAFELPAEKHEPSWPVVQAVKDALTKVSIKILLGVVAVKEYFSGE